MNQEQITTVRRIACAMITSLGQTVDALRSIEETLVNPTPKGRDLDHVLAIRCLGEAALFASSLAEGAHELAAALNQHVREAQDRRP